MARSGYEQNLIFQCRVAKLPTVTPELRFAPPRRWRFDLAFEQHRLAVEVEGAVYTGGRHTRGAGFERDAEKYAEAIIRGWRVMRVSTGQVKSGVALVWIERALAASVAVETGI